MSSSNQANSNNHVNTELEPRTRSLYGYDWSIFLVRSYELKVYIGDLDDEMKPDTFMSADNDTE